MNSFESFLTGYFSGRSSRLFPRASTGLYALFAALREDFGPGEVIVPAICCESVAMAALYAGLKPVITDVDPATLCLSVDSVREHITSSTRAIVLVYIFGNLFDVRPFLDLKQKNGLILVEDLAQGVGGQRAGEEVGRACDFTLLSFSDDKILKGSGGALIQRSEYDSYERIKRDLPAASPARTISMKRLSLRNLCHSLYDLSREDESINVADIFGRMVPYYRDIFVYQKSADWSEGTVDQMRSIEELRGDRFEKYLFYRSNLKSDLIRVVDPGEGAMCWRCCLLMEEPSHVFPLTSLLRRNGIPASNHYFPLDKLLYNERHIHSEAVASRIINLWVDESVTKEQMEKTVELINRFST